MTPLLLVEILHEEACEIQQFPDVLQPPLYSPRIERRPLPPYDRGKGMGQKPLFILRDLEVEPEGTEAPSEFLSEFLCCPLQPYYWSQFGVPPLCCYPTLETLLAWSYPGPECTTAVVEAQ